MPNLMLVLFWSASAALPLPMFVQYLARLWQIDQYQYFPILIVTLAVLAFARWDRQLSYPNSKLAWSMLLAGWLAAGAGAIVNSPWAASIGLVLILGSWFLTHRDSRPSKGSLLHLWFPTWMLIRLPFGLDLRLTNWLQYLTSIISGELFNVLGIPHTRNGNVFELPHGAMLVEEACSGVQSLFSLLFCAFMLVAWLRRSSMLLPMYAIAAIVSALVMNIFRVIAIGVGQEWYKVDLAHGVLHETLGYTCLGLAILLLGSADCLLRVLFFPVPESREDGQWNPIQHLWNLSLTTEVVEGTSSRRKRYITPLIGHLKSGKTLGIVLSMLAVCLWLPQLGHLLAQPATAWESGKNAFWTPAADMFQGIEQLALAKHESTKGGSNPVLGENADVWDAQFNGMTIQIVLSQPYPEFHDLVWCYTGQGWEKTSQALATEADWKYVTCGFVKPPRQFGLLIYGGLGRDGHPVAPLEISPITMVSEWLQWRNRNAFASAQGCQMLQLFAHTEEPLSKEQSESLIELYLKLREAMRSSYLTTVGK